MLISIQMYFTVNKSEWWQFLHHFKNASRWTHPLLRSWALPVDLATGAIPFWTRFIKQMWNSESPGAEAVNKRDITTPQNILHYCTKQGFQSFTTNASRNAEVKGHEGTLLIFPIGSGLASILFIWHVNKSTARSAVPSYLKTYYCLLNAYVEKEV